MSKEIVSADWLFKNLNNNNLIVLDASLESTIGGIVPENNDKVIPTSRFFDLKNNFCDKNSSYPNTLPPEQQFEEECQKLGINKSSQIVVYDNHGVYSSPRVWWMFKVMGHENVVVLDGGLPEWIGKGYDTVEKVNEKYIPGNFKASFQSRFVKTYKDILQNTKLDSFQVVDARSNGRFKGIEKEPRKYLKSGHIPNSINIPYQNVLKKGKFKSVEDLKEIFEQKCSHSKAMVFTCGSGLTACIVMLAAEISFKESKTIYDGSWTEWAELQGLKEIAE